ncbi:hypothetical protein ACIHDR_18220 [Nocardia sp. NPDC052278]|uniref:hypothetical protein n=1 Tax=unclassified Nocardia TaxID=2637762 RepID=UPI0036C60BEB
MSSGPLRPTPLWFELWMGAITTVIALLCAALCWELAAQGSFAAKVLLWVGLSVVGLVAIVFAILGLIRYHAVLVSLTAPLLIAALAALVWYEVPETAGWRLSRPILEDQATACANPGHRTRLGVYTVTYITRRDGACLFYVSGGATNSEGFAYFPDSAPSTGPAGPGGIGYEPFHGPWYRFVENT